MKWLNFIGSSLFQILSIFFAFGYLLGILNIHFSDKNDYCVMTFMFEYPQFVKLTIMENNEYPQYGLYAYSEGRFTERARKMWFDGVPVLFLPGNSGSHMQVRSLASVALRKSLSKGYDYHFDYFTIGYNEEWSGVFGGILESQTDFAAACISNILSLYKANKYTKSVPKSVILIGHSMGGVIAKRLMAYPSTVNSTSIGISLAAPLQAPLINFDVFLNDYYLNTHEEWRTNINDNEEVKRKKLFISIGGGPRDTLMPTGLTMSNESYINVASTAIPGAWVSSDHVSIVWCKQIVLAINRYLFSVVDPTVGQVTEKRAILTGKAKEYFQANRSMVLDPMITRPNVPMIADAFWYEDNRRIYQISRPDIDKMTYLMVRLISFPQNRFVAIQAINLEDKDWVFGCNAKFTHNTHRYCKQATSLGELSRWTGAANDAGKRKLATIYLHQISDAYPDWTHVVVKLSPTRKPVKLNIDTNDYWSRKIYVALPADYKFSKKVIKQQSEPGSIYYELVLKNFHMVHQAYLLYVEPHESCKATKYHVSAEVHIPWAENNEYYHYFTNTKRSPMKLRLFHTNPNITKGLHPTQHVRVTLLLDPQCTFTISISSAWYHRLAQLARHYTPVLLPYVSAIILLSVRTNIMSLQLTGLCMSMNSALMSEGVRPYYPLVFGRLILSCIMLIPGMLAVFDNASWEYIELQYFIKSFLVLPAYITALGLLNVTIAGIVAVMVFSSQLTHRLFFRIIWRGGPGLAERMATGLQKSPLIVSSALLCTVHISCGAASLVAGAAFYAFMISKMYEEYLEDFFYKLLAKIASKMCRLFKRGNQNISETAPLIQLNDTNEETTENVTEAEAESTQQNKKSETAAIESEYDEQYFTSEEREIIHRIKCENPNKALSNLNFHMELFLMWLVVTLVNVPSLLTWARNFKYSISLNLDASYHAGLVLSVCSIYLWQLDGPRKHLKHYDIVTTILFTMAACMIALGPLSLVTVSYGFTFVFIVITIQQKFDVELKDDIATNSKENSDAGNKETKEKEKASDGKKSNDRDKGDRTDNVKGKKKKSDCKKSNNRDKGGSTDNVKGKKKESDCKKSNDRDKGNSTDNVKGKNKESDCKKSNDQDKGDSTDNVKDKEGSSDYEKGKGDSSNEKDTGNSSGKEKGESGSTIKENTETDSINCDDCDESKIYSMFKNLREKISYSEE